LHQENFNVYDFCFIKTRTHAQHNNKIVAARNWLMISQSLCDLVSQQLHHPKYGNLNFRKNNPSFVLFVH